MSYTKIYLKTKPFRRGSPVLIYATRDTEDKKVRYSLGIYHEIRPVPKNQKHYKGIGKEYSACQKVAISKELYNAFVKEARANQKRVDQIEAYRKKYFRKCRVCGSDKKIGEPCEICIGIKGIYKKGFGKSPKSLSMKKIIKQLKTIGALKVDDEREL